MRIQWKIVLLVFLVLSGTLAAVTWKTRSLVLKDKMSFMADAAMKQMAPLKRLVAERLEDRKSKLVNFATTRFQSQTVSRNKMPREFDVIALVRPASGSEWTPLWSEKNRTSTATNWPVGYDLTLLKSLPFARVKDGETLWVRLSDHQGSPVYGMLMAVEIQNAAASPVPTSAALPETTDYANSERSRHRAILVGFTIVDPLADVAEDYIGSTTTVYVVDDKGYVASHVNKAYLGALFSEDPIVGEILTQKKTGASGTYEDLESRPVLGHFERIDGTNLYAVATMPLRAAHDFIGTVDRTIFSAGLSLGVIGLILAWFLGRGFSTPVQSEMTAQVGAADEASENQNTVSEAEATGGDPSVSVETPGLPQNTADAEESLLEGFIEGTKEPLMAILGHAQLIKVKAGEDEAVRNHAESVERESRRAKDVLERLREWKKQTAPGSSADLVNLRETVTEAFARREGELKAEDVELTLDLHDVPSTRGIAEQMRTVIMNLVDNALEAMRARNPKRLEVQLDFVENAIFMVVRDNGIGMTRDVSEKAFQPFFKAFQSSKGMGLGLAFVRSVVSGASGQCTIESLPGEGTTVRIQLPVSSAEKEEFRREQAAKLVEAISEKLGPMPEILSREAESDAEEAKNLDDGEIDDDDSDDAFASVSLGISLGVMTKPAEVEDAVVEADAGDSEFEVRIRRPRARS